MFLRSIAFLCIFSILQGASPVLSAPLAANSQLNIYRFYGLTDTASAHATNYVLTDGLFKPRHTGLVTVKSPNVLSGVPARADSPVVPKPSTCTDLLDHLQSFSLYVMKEVAYVNDEQLKSQSDLIKNFFPAQVSFIEVTQPISREEVLAQPEKYPQHTRAPRPDIDDPTQIPIRQAALWVISGQTIIANEREKFLTEMREKQEGYMKVPWNAALPNAKDDYEFSLRTIPLGVHPMPWEISLGAMVSRQKYPMVWEFGRLAQVGRHHASTLMTSALTLVQDEIETMLHGDPSQAYIFVKALDPLRKRLFEKNGFTPVEGACETENSCVLVAPFLELIKRFPPGSQSWRLNKAKELLKKQSDASFDAEMNILRRTHVWFRAEMDFIVPEAGIYEPAPIILHDYSRNHHALLQAAGESLGLQTEDALKFAKQMKEFTSDFSPPNSALIDPIPMEPFYSEFQRNNVVRLTNLHPRLAENKSALPLLLLAADRYLARRYEEFRVTNAEKILDHFQTKLVLQTTSGAVAGRLREIAAKLGAQEYQPVGTIRSFLFTRENLRQLESEQPELRLLREEALAQGYWFFRSLNARSMKF